MKKMQMKSFVFHFFRMSIIGQFNRGFILVSLADHTTQLFIVDQHAADEIYNFHRLYEQKTLSRQPLLHPKILPLDPSRQILLQQHLDLFNRLGLVSKNTIFLLNYQVLS